MSKTKTMNVLSDAQLAVLTAAATQNAGRITRFPDHIKGGARTKLLDSLDRHRMAAQDSTGDWLLSHAGYQAIGLELSARRFTGASQVLADEVGMTDPTDAKIAASNDVGPEIEAAVAAVETTAQAEAKTPRTRANTKQAQVIAMLKRPEGATISQICEATQWQAHTVRGTFAGAFKKKLRLNVVSEKVEGGDRIYRIT